MHLYQIGVVLSNKTNTRFSKHNHYTRKCCQTKQPLDLTSIIVTRENANIEEMSEMYKSDLPSLHSLDIDYDTWIRKWKSEVTKPVSLQPALEVKHFSSHLKSILVE